jgi:serine kinase of HPr protein (carbohydrate metabolism regulator)
VSADGADGDTQAATEHGTCVAIGGHGILIIGASGAGKSTLALKLILDAPRALPPAELVADDRVILEAAEGSLTARPPPLLAGLIEVRGLGIRRLSHRPQVKLSHVVQLDPLAQLMRMPNEDACLAHIRGCALHRIASTTPEQAALLLAAAILTADYQN